MRGLLGRHAVEQCILLAFELDDRTGQHIALAAEGVGVTATLAGLGVRERGLGDQCPEAGTVGFLLHVQELFLRDGKIGAQSPEPVADVDETTLEEGMGHDGILRATAPDGPWQSRPRCRSADDGARQNRVKNPRLRVRKA